MHAPKQIVDVWDQFNDFPMERLTKLWFYKQGANKKQRDVSLMKEHREQYGIAGNCFDLSIWLMHELHNANIEAYPIGHHLDSKSAHVAIIALDEAGNRYLCDLGDQWICPILIDKEHEEFTEEKLPNFFPAATIQVKQDGPILQILYHRPNSKTSMQLYDLQPIDTRDFYQAAEYNQNQINQKPLVECRVPYGSEIAHWEFSNWESFFSCNSGLMKEPTYNSVNDWADKIHDMTGYNKQFVRTALNLYKNIR